MNQFTPWLPDTFLISHEEMDEWLQQCKPNDWRPDLNPHLFSHQIQTIVLLAELYSVMHRANKGKLIK